MKKISKIRLTSIIVLVIMVGLAFIGIFVDMPMLTPISYLIGFSIQVILLHKIGISLRSKGMDLICLVCSYLGMVLSVIRFIVALL